MNHRTNFTHMIASTFAVTMPGLTVGCVCSTNHSWKRQVSETNDSLFFLKNHSQYRIILHIKEYNLFFTHFPSMNINASYMTKQRLSLYCTLQVSHLLFMFPSNDSMSMKFITIYPVFYKDKMSFTNTTMNSSPRL